MTEQEIYQEEMAPADVEIPEPAQVEVNSAVQDSTEPVDPYAAIAEAAKISVTVGNFERRLDVLDLQQQGQDAYSHKVIDQATRNLRGIDSGYEGYQVVSNLTNNGKSVLGTTDLSSKSVEINANHLADVYDNDAAKNIEKTFRHEKEHTKQKALPDNFKVVDPKTDTVIDAKILLEGGAEKATADALGGGRQDIEVIQSSDPDSQAYRQGFNLYNSYGVDTFNPTILEGGGHAGNRVELQADLIKRAGVSDPEEILKLAKKAEFSKQEQNELIQILGIDPELPV